MRLCKEVELFTSSLVKWGQEVIGQFFIDALPPAPRPQPPPDRRPKKRSLDHIAELKAKLANLPCLDPKNGVSKYFLSYFLYTVSPFQSVCLALAYLQEEICGINCGVYMPGFDLFCLLSFLREKKPSLLFIALLEKMIPNEVLSADGLSVCGTKGTAAIPRNIICAALGMFCL